MAAKNRRSISVRENTRRVNQRMRDQERRRDRSAKLALPAAWLRDAIAEHVSWLPNERETVNV